MVTGDHVFGAYLVGKDDIARAVVRNHVTEHSTAHLLSGRSSDTDANSETSWLPRLLAK
jgi:hypothetical protein